MKRIFLLFTCLSILSLSVLAIKPEKELSKLYIGMPIKEVKSLYGEPTYSKYEKDTKTRMLLYNFYKKEGGLAEYHIYFSNDSLTYLMLCENNEEIRKPIVGDNYLLFLQEENDGTISFVKDYTIEGKSIVFTKIIDDVSLNNEQIKEAVLVAIARACNGSQGEITMAESTRVLYHGIIDKVITFDRRWGVINVIYSIDIAIKQGRVRIKVIGEEIDWHQDYEKATYYFSETFPIGKETIKGVSNDDASEMLRNITKIFNQFISVIEEELSKTANDNDW